MVFRLISGREQGKADAGAEGLATAASGLSRARVRSPAPMRWPSLAHPGLFNGAGLRSLPGTRWQSRGWRSVGLRQRLGALRPPSTRAISPRPGSWSWFGGTQTSTSTRCLPSRSPCSPRAGFKGSSAASCRPRAGWAPMTSPRRSLSEGNDEFAALGQESNNMFSQPARPRLDELSQEPARLRGPIRRIGQTFASDLDRHACSSSPRRPRSMLCTPTVVG